MPQLIGIYGKAGTGKDTIAEFLVDQYRHMYRQAFADPLKECAAAAFGIPLEQFNDPITKETNNIFWDSTPRKIAQFVGTEMFRELIEKLIPQVGKDFWVKRFDMRISNIYVPDDEGEYEPTDTIVIPDTRFQNEYDYIISKGGSIIHLTRPGKEGAVGIVGHPSESGLNAHTKERTYEIVNDGTIQQLYKKVHDTIFAIKNF